MTIAPSRGPAGAPSRPSRTAVMGRPDAMPRRDAANTLAPPLSFNDIDPNRRTNRVGTTYTSPLPRIDTFRPSTVYNPIYSPRNRGPISRCPTSSYSRWCRPVYLNYVKPCYPTRYNTYVYGGAYLGASWYTSPIYDSWYYDRPYTYVAPTVVEVPYPVYIERSSFDSRAAPRLDQPQSSTESYQSPELIDDFAGPRLPVEGVDDAAEARMRPFLNAGFRAMQSNLYSLAQRNFLLATFADDRDGVALMLYAVSCFAVGDYELSASALRQALEMTPELIDQPFDIRGLYSDQSELDRHMSALIDVVHSGPATPDFHLLLGYLHFSTGDPSHAVITLGEGSALDPSDELLSRVREAALYVQKP